MTATQRSSQLNGTLDIAKAEPELAVAGATNPSAGGTTTNYYEGPNRSLADRTFADVKVASFILTIPSQLRTQSIWF